MTLKATYDGRALVLHEPIDLAPGTECDLTLNIPSKGQGQSDTKAVSPALEELLRFVESVELSADFPDDACAQHDHYLYGTPKRLDP